MSVDSHPDESLAEAPYPRLGALPAFADNYIWSLACPRGKRALVVDPGDPEPVRQWLAREQLALAAVLVTHHHADHTGGIAALRGPGVTVYGPRGEDIDGVDIRLGDGDRIRPEGFELEFRVLDVPGHTRGHIAYLGEAAGRPPLLFCGDTLFSAGCGRLFEGSPAQMHASLQRLAALPADTRVCCTHEYTLANLRFAAAVEPDNPDIAHFRAWATHRREQGLPTVPGTLARELRVNPFLRTSAGTVVEAAQRVDALTAAAGEAGVFTVLRRWKDGFR